MQIIISGPSGVGKDTLIDEWIKQNPLVKRAVTSTSRPPRDSEQDGIDYHFLSRSDMDKKIQNGEFLEHKEVFGELYGLPKGSVDTIVDAGGIAIIRVDVQGALELMPKMPSAHSIFILPPSLSELQKRIENRKSDTEEKIKERMDTAIAEIIFSCFYKNHIFNIHTPNAVRHLENVLKGWVYKTDLLTIECLSLKEQSALTMEKLQIFSKLAKENNLLYN